MSPIKQVKISLPLKFYKEGDYIACYCPVLDLGGLLTLPIFHPQLAMEKYHLKLFTRK